MPGLRLLFVLAALVVTTSAVGAQQTQSGDLTQARRALAAGQPQSALNIVEPLLAQTPSNQELAEFAIQAALALDDTIRAYGYYDIFIQAVGIDSAALLKPIAMRELRRVVANATDDPRLRAEALERLARGGDPRARTDLRPDLEPHQHRQGLLDDAALARLGDEAAANRLAAAIASPEVTDKKFVAEALRLAGDPRQAQALVPLLRHRDPYTRLAAIDGLTALGYAGAAAEIRTLLTDPYTEVRNRASLALARLGDPAGKDVIARMLQSPVADVRLAALEADPTLNAAQRAAVIRPILADDEPMNRAKAAEALARDDPDSARPYLIALLKDPDISPRREAARVLEKLPRVDVSVYRQLMADRDQWVRMYGAAGVVRAAAPAI